MVSAVSGIRGVLVGIGVVVAFNGAVLALRLRSLAAQGDLISTTLGEGQVLYPIWKVLNGHPLYEWPYAENYGLTLYNAGFYHSYAALIGFVGRIDEFLPHARALTAVFACLGCVVFCLAARALFVRLHGRLPGRDEQLLHVGLGCILWFGTASTGWWILAARPDVPALVLVTAGLLALLAGDEERLRPVVLSATAFFLAWTFKQSVIGVVLGVLAYLVLTRQVSRLLTFGAIYFGFIAVFLLGGSDQYRASIIGAAGIHGIDPVQSATAFGRIWATNILLALPAVWLALDRSRLEQRFNWMLILTCLSANIFAFVTLGKQGAEKNHAFEALMVVALVAAAACHRDHLVGRLRTVVLAACLAMAGLCVTQVAFANRFGKITMASPAEYAAKEAVRRFMTTLPKPIFIRDELLAQPWYTTDNRYPAPVIDHSNYRDARLRGVVTGLGMLEWVDQRRYATFVLDPRDAFAPFVAAAYVPLPQPPEIERLNLMVYIRPADGSR